VGKEPRAVQACTWLLYIPNSWRRHMMTSWGCWHGSGGFSRPRRWTLGSWCHSWTTGVKAKEDKARAGAGNHTRKQDIFIFLLLFFLTWSTELNTAEFSFSKGAALGPRWRMSRWLRLHSGAACPEGRALWAAAAFFFFFCRSAFEFKFWLLLWYFKMQDVCIQRKADDVIFCLT